jgi:hypothetical protein
MSVQDLARRASLKASVMFELGLTQSGGYVTYFTAKGNGLCLPRDPVNSTTTEALFTLP